MLTRELIRSGDYLRLYTTLPHAWRWPRERILRSLEETMRIRPDGGDVWVFGYGSLIWNPLLDFQAQQAAALDGWHRSFCLRMVVGRATNETPGRMLALEPEGRTHGVVYRLATQKLEQELPLLWQREMVSGAYLPTWLPVDLANGQRVHALVFVADRRRPQFEIDSSVATVAPLIARASGVHGSNADYVFKLSFALADRGCTDDYVEALACELRRIGSHMQHGADRALP
ncbi:gamma-glutamylcyclotransferase [Bordetella genomosp. 8]|uniref:glutathione-specific gamma-glutamylcyclotransferase n=1 Tax=Bordetella genomosp. 8 TaxID=1416806 RepID=A0A1W6YL75_9BORD|nr:gamma-glutamylcyclotransferase [Bordetella genomosp. 8]ARP81835.1 gamma-glutamylcyclotransferase [Bordetella genomosp. 8]